MVEYIEARRHLRLDDFKREFNKVLEPIKKYKTVDSTTKIFEVGCGIGWFQLLCKQHGLSCVGIDKSPELIDYSRQFAKDCGLAVDTELGNIETDDIGDNEYDVVVACSVFEHVEHWREGIANVYRALKVGGIFYFVSTNRFSIMPTGEYGAVGYGLLSLGVRRYLRRRQQGRIIADASLDYNQFNYFKLAKYFKEVGFAEVHDFSEFYEPSYFDKGWQKVGIKAMRKSYPIKILGLLVAPITSVICVK